MKTLILSALAAVGLASSASALTISVITAEPRNFLVTWEHTPGSPTEASVLDTPFGCFFMEIGESTTSFQFIPVRAPEFIDEIPHDSDAQHNLVYFPNHYAIYEYDSNVDGENLNGSARFHTNNTNIPEGAPGVIALAGLLGVAGIARRRLSR